MVALLFLLLTVAGSLLLFAGLAPAIPAWLLWFATGLSAILLLHELAGRPIPFLRWSVLRMMLGMGRLTTEWQVGDGREEGAARFVIEKAPAGNVEAAIRAIDEYAYKHKFLINVGDEKGAILDGVIERVQPRQVLELGAYVGYSALRIARKDLVLESTLLR